MAGIGFELRRMLQQETFTALVRVYVFGAVIVLGPFLSSVVCLAGLAVVSAGVADLVTRQIFTGAAVYVFGGSLITTGLVQVVVTRYLADKVYRGEYDNLVQSVFPVVAVTSVVLAAGAIPFLVGLDLSVFAKVVLLALYLTIGALWIVVVFVTAAHGHRSVVVTFVVGSAVALGLGLALVGRLGLEGLLVGYTTGHFLILVLLVDKLVREFGVPDRWDWGVLRYVRRFPELVAIGLVGNLGVWIDKFVFWTSELAAHSGGIVTAPKYDSALFLAFLTAQPAVVHFFVKQETDFEQAFHGYFDEVFFRSSYERIRDAADALRGAVGRSLVEILKLQGMVTFLALFFAEEILRALGLPVSQIGMFRAGTLGSLFLVFMLFSNVILLYLDRRREALISVVVLLGANLGLSLLTLRLGYPFFGFGFAAACLVAMATSLYQLSGQLHHLEFVTFATIPITGQRRSRRSLRAHPDGMFGRYNPIHRGPDR